MTDHTSPSLKDSATSTPVRILVVDDNFDVMDSLAMVLRAIGHEVLAADSGEEALEVMEHWLPELAFIDVGLPGISGFELAEEVRRREWGANIVLIAMTGWGSSEDKRRSHAAGFNQHAVKPVDLQQLRALIDSVPART